MIGEQELMEFIISINGEISLFRAFVLAFSVVQEHVGDKI